MAELALFGGSHLTAGAELAPRPMVWHFPHYRSKAIPPYSILRLDDEKLLHWWDDGRTELYDLAGDLGETQDLAAVRVERVAELRALMAASR